jgi:hypothetical protein
MKQQTTCPICGKPSRTYMGNTRKDKLCGIHADELKAGKIIINDKGLFEDSVTHMILNKDFINSKVTIESTKMPIKQETNSLVTGKCIACGRPTKSGFFFCPDCYHKYKEKKLLIEIRNCTDFTILDDSYEGIYNCDDGHVVKSKSEMIIDNYLFEKGIPHAYEKALPIDGDPKNDLHPDFFLPNFQGKGTDVYIEHWGFNENNIKYTESKKYKLEKYRDLKITLVCTNEKDMSDPKTALKRKLEYFEVGKINFSD